MGSGGARFLSVTAEHFVETGEWPSFDEVQTLLAQHKDLSSVRRRAKHLPRSLGKRDQGLIVLSVRGIHRADPNEPLLGSFLAALIWATRGYLGKEGRKQSSFSERELVQDVGLSATRAEQVMALFSSEGLVAAPLANSPDKKARITSRILPYLYVSSLKDYLRIRKKEDRKHQLRRIAAAPCRLVRWFQKEDTSIAAKIAVTVLGTVVATVLLVLILGSRIPTPHDPGAGSSVGPVKQGKDLEDHSR